MAHRSLFSDPPPADVADPDGDEGYRPVSGLAIAALLLGGLSAAAFVGPALWPTAAFATLVAAVAVRATSRPDERLIGRGMALAGLALAVGFGCAGVASWTAAGRLANRRAEDAAEAWVTLILAGSHLEARSMLAPEVMPVGMVTAAGVGDELARPIADPDADAAAFRGLGAVDTILACGAGGVVTAAFEEHLPESQERREEWRVRVRVDPCAGDEALAIVVRLRREMIHDAATPAGWAENWSVVGIDRRG